MRRLVCFLTLSVDGYFTDEHGDMNWAHSRDPEFDAFVSSNASGDGEFLFGRRTYEMMASFWPTPQAAQMMPDVAERMNSRPKHVVSRTLNELGWENSVLLEGELVEGVQALKNSPGPDLVILGSGSVVAQLADAGLIDEFQFVIAPIALGGGRTPFEGLESKLGLRLTETRAFQNGKIFARYEVADSK